MTNRETVKAWIQGAGRVEVKNATGSIYSEEGILYSYGKHFQLAAFDTNGDLHITTATWGPTTGKHKGTVRACLGYLPTGRVVVEELLYNRWPAYTATGYNSEGRDMTTEARIYFHGYNGLEAAAVKAVHDGVMEARGSMGEAV